MSNRIPKAILTLVLSAGSSQATTLFVSNTTSIAIPNVGAATPYPSNITVAGLLGTITSVTVTLTNISHTFPDDIDALLVGPTGAKLLLMSDAGGGNDLNNVTLTFNDLSALTLPNGGTIVSGTFRPTNFGTGDTFASPAPGGPYAATLSTFNGTNPNGTWSLFVTDDGGGNNGTIAGGWSMTITDTTTPEPSTSLLIGAGLAGVTALSRRRRASR